MSAAGRDSVTDAVLRCAAMHHAATAPHAAPPPALAATAAAIEAMGATLEVAEALLAAGRAVDLAGLDAEAAALCAAVLTLDRQEARALRGALGQLARQVDRLRVALAPP